MFNIRRALLASVSLLIVSGVGCTKSANNSPTQIQNSEDAFSDRPINAVADVYVITLKSPPLLVAGTKTGNQWNIPAAAKDAVLKEQADFETQLSVLAPDAKIVYRYRLVLNGFAIYAKPDAIAALEKIGSVQSVKPALQMARPQTESGVSTGLLAMGINSSNFIGSQVAYANGYTGKGLRLGVLDTGIDYTHSMLGGSGSASDFKSIDPSQPSAQFPNAKVIGGTDLAGTDFDAGSPFAEKHLPKPDSNPIDEGGHGSHVAGTIAGKGDGVNSYDGIAKDASLYAVKVFGKDGSTMDATVVAGFEFAADPNGDLDPSDQLDVINLSLGGGFGQPQILYNVAVANLSNAGTLVVASAGNSGDVDYIVGAPGTSDEAFSIAASIDGSEFNWRFPAVRFVTVNNSNWLAKAIEGSITKPIKEATVTAGELYDIGFADKDLTDTEKSELSGKIALIQRGKVAFADKIKRAQEAGAIGVVVFNNVPDKPIVMGGEGKFDIPGIMVSQALGQKLLSEMALGPASIDFKTTEIIEEPQLVDSITDFSSKGPRSQDNLIKPEIAAPGQAIISAAMGEGSATVKMDGTSMAAPHMTGAMALIKQAHPDFSARDLKALAMNTAKILTSGDGGVPVSRQGAGRIQIDEALQSPVVIEPAALSLGQVQLNESKKLQRTLKIRNIVNRDVELEIETKSSQGLAISSVNKITIPAGQTVDLPLNIDVSIFSPSKYVAELDGQILFRDNGRLAAHVPALAVRTIASQVSSADTTISSGINLSNTSSNAGIALPFNLLGQDAKKQALSPSDSWKSRACDLEAVGYRVVQRTGPADAEDRLQFAFKMYDALTTWNVCDVSVLVDADDDDVADQEIAGATPGSIKGLSPDKYRTVLLDAKKARDIRLAYETDLAAGVDKDASFKGAVLEEGAMLPFAHSSVIMIDIPVSKLAKSADGKLKIKVASIYEAGDSVESDDFLDDGLSEWKEISLVPQEHAFYGFDEIVSVPQGSTLSPVQRGTGAGKLVIFYPLNLQRDVNGNDLQMQVF